MTFDWIHFLELANTLVEEVDKETVSTLNLSVMQEAVLHAAIGRAYYAAFGRARKFLLAEQPSMPIPMNGSHSYVYRQFYSSRNSLRQHIAEKLRDLRDLRERADYNDAPISNLMLQSRFALVWSHETIEALEKLSTRSA